MLLSWAMGGTGWRAFGCRGNRCWRGWLIPVAWIWLAGGGGALHAQNNFPIAIPNGDFADPANEGSVTVTPPSGFYTTTLGAGPWQGVGIGFALNNTVLIEAPATSISGGKAAISAFDTSSNSFPSWGGFDLPSVGEILYAGWTYVLSVEVSTPTHPVPIAWDDLGYELRVTPVMASVYNSPVTVTPIAGGESAVLSVTMTTPAPYVGLPMGISLRVFAQGTPQGYAALDAVGTVLFDNVQLIAYPAPPQLQCPPMLYLSAGAECTAVVPSVTVPVVPGSSPFTSFTYHQVPAAGSSLSLGKGWITVTVTDPFGGSTVCSIPVMVIDTTPPVVSCVSLEPVDTCTGAIPDVTGMVWAQDYCTPFHELQITQSPAPGTPVGPGTHIIQVAVTDAGFNTGYCLVEYTVTPSQATNPIVLHNTGMDAPGAPAMPSGADAHYVMTVSPDPVYPGPTAHIIDPLPAMWAPNGVSTDSQWISASRDDLYIPVAGTYVFTQEFTLPQGLTGATISGRWMSDNAAEIHLNGVPTGQTTPAGGYTAWTPFVLTSGFVEGINTLDFVVESLPVFGPTSYSGVRVEMSGQVTFCDNPCVAPYIISQPVSTHGIHFPGEAIFSVTAGGTGPFTYQWYYNGIPIAGATGPSLIAAPATVYLPGSYYVVVTNGCGLVVSGTATRFSPFAVGHVAHWSGASVAALSSQPGGSLTYLDAEAPDYNRTELLTRFGPSDAFGLPGLNGLPLPVMRVQRNSPKMGYVLEGHVTPGSGRHTFVLDVLIPPEQADRLIPLLQANPENTEAADLYLYAGDGDAPKLDRTVIVPVNEWVRIVVTIDPDADLDESVVRWFVNGMAQGTENTGPIRWMPPEAIRSTSSDGDDPEPVPMRVLLFTDFSEVDFHLYVAHVAWWDRTLADFEVNALGAPRRSGIILRDFTEPLPQLTVTRVEPADPDDGDTTTLSFRWFGEGMRLQQSTDLVTWETYPGFPAMEMIGGRMRNEVEVTLEDPSAPAFSDLDLSGSGRGAGLFMRLQVEQP